MNIKILQDVNFWNQGDANVHYNDALFWSIDSLSNEELHKPCSDTSWIIDYNYVHMKHYPNHGEFTIIMHKKLYLYFQMKNYTIMNGNNLVFQVNYLKGMRMIL